MPPTRALTNLKGVRTMIYAAPKAKPDILYIGLNDRDPQWHDLYELHISTGEKTLLRKNTEQIAGWDFDHDGNLRLAERTNQAGDTEILRVDPDGFKQIYSCTVLEDCGVADFDAANKQVYLITNKGDAGPERTGAAGSGDRRDAPKVESDPEKRVDFGRPGDLGRRLPHLLHPVRGRPLRGCTSRTRRFEQEYRWLQSKLPGKEIRFRRAVEGREHLDRERVRATPSPARPMSGIARRKRWRCNTASARNCRANRSRSASRTTSNRPTGWRFRPT